MELTGHDECCGFGGLFSIKNAEISTAMGRRKCLNLAQSGADVVALCDVSCMTHINGLLSRQAQHVRAVHIAEILNSQVDVEEEGAEPGAEDSAPPSASSPAGSPPASSPSGGQPRRWQDMR